MRVNFFTYLLRFALLLFAIFSGFLAAIGVLPCLVSGLIVAIFFPTMMDQAIFFYMIGMALWFYYKAIRAFRPLIDHQLEILSKQTDQLARSEQ